MSAVILPPSPLAILQTTYSPVANHDSLLRQHPWLNCRLAPPCKCRYSHSIAIALPEKVLFLPNGLYIYWHLQDVHGSQAAEAWLNEHPAAQS